MFTYLVAIVTEFKKSIRSHLQNNGHSDFTLGRTATFKSDISFVSNDRGTFRSSSPSRSSNCSDWSLDSYEPSYVALSGVNSFASPPPPPESTGDSTVTLLVYDPSWHLLSDFKFVFTHPFSTLYLQADELRRLRLELTNTKGIYESVHDETPEMKILISEHTTKAPLQNWHVSYILHLLICKFHFSDIKGNSLYLEENQGANVTCRSTRAIAKFESKRLQWFDSRGDRIWGGGWMLLI